MTEIAGIVSGFGSLGVAAPVYLSSRGFSRRAQEVSERAAAVEDQKFRLALLDRRGVVIDAIYDAAGKFSTNPSDAAETMEKARVALRAAWLVYEPEQQAMIRKLIDDIWEWQRLERRLKTANDKDRSVKVDELMNKEVEIGPALIDLHKALVDMTRVQEVRLNER